MIRHRSLQIVRSVLMGCIAASAIACQSNIPADSASVSPAPAVSPAEPSPVPQSQAIYRSDRLGFQFSYDESAFVANRVAEPPASDQDPPLEAIDIWTKAHDQEIRSGDYEDGTEYPANVRVSVFRNPEQLPLQEWVQQSIYVAMPESFEETTVAGQPAIAFQSSGLYENEQVAFATPDGSSLVLITVSKTNYGEDDARYQSAFEQIVRSFAFDS